MADHDLGRRRLTDLDPQLEQFTVDARGAPQRVLPAHSPDQIPHLRGHRRASPPSRSGFPTPEQPKTLAVPANYGLRFDDDDGVHATGPQAIEPDPEEPVDPGQPGPGRPYALEHRQLMAKGNEFELQRGPVSKAREDGGEQQREDRMHPLTLSASTPNR